MMAQIYSAVCRSSLSFPALEPLVRTVTIIQGDEASGKCRLAGDAGGDQLEWHDWLGEVNRQTAPIMHCVPFSLLRGDSSQLTHDNTSAFSAARTGHLLRKNKSNPTVC